nr:LOW QUALITY PROTEIN: uncharacterized protein LOC132761625 [Anolis sagrei ordinatus]
MGATGDQCLRPFLQERRCQLANKEVTHSFLYMPNCPVPLLGRDMLCKLKARLSFEEDGSAKMAVGRTTGLLHLTCPMEEEWRLLVVKKGSENNEWEKFETPEVWAEDNPPGMAKYIPPVVVELIPGARPVSLKQYPIPRPAIKGIQKHLDRLWQHGIITKCQSPWNTPLLPVKKPGTTDDFRPVQDLREVNKATVTLHPVVPNPYVILGLIPAEATHFTVLDLKDAFFSIRLAPQSQLLFAFEWEDPATGAKQQYSWARLPQGFKNSPTIFGTSLAKDLEDFHSDSEKTVLLQYVDDLLLASTSMEESWGATKQLLQLLCHKGYKVSRTNAQLCKTEVKYLGFQIKQGFRSLGTERKQAICQIPVPTTRKRVREFLGAAGFCRLWIPGYAVLARPLYQVTKGGEKEPFKWTQEQDEAFQQIKSALMTAPALGLPDVTKPFTLYVAEKEGVAIGVLTQTLGFWPRPVAYLSKQLDMVAKGWPPCLRAVAAAALVAEEAQKLTLGQDLTIKAPHEVVTLLEHKGHHWLTTSRMLKYQTLLCENPHIKVQQCTTLNPATLLPIDPHMEKHHSCIEVMDTVYASRPDLTDVPLQGAQLTIYTDGSSYMEEGERKAGYAIVTIKEILEANPLPANTSAQKAELIALTRALEIAKGKRVNIYTDSKYAFLVLHAHGALYKERRLLTAAGQPVKRTEEILHLLEAVWAPKQVAVMHCKGHQPGQDPVAQGNRRADAAAKEAAARPLQVATLLPLPNPKVQPTYNKEEQQWAQDNGAVELANSTGWLAFPDGRIIVPRTMAWEVVKGAHESIHLGKMALAKLLERQLYIDGLHSLTMAASARCHTCAKNNPRQGPCQPPGIQHCGNVPFEAIVVDFSEMRVGRYRYLLVMVDTFTGWPEVYPTVTEKATEVARALMKDIIPRHGMPAFIGSDNGPAFVKATIQSLAKVLGITWKLHCAYRPQSSGKVERMNRTLKTKLAKMCQETELSWIQLLPLAVLHIRCTPTKTIGLSPFEMLYGRPPPLFPRLQGELHEIGAQAKRQEMVALGKTLQELRQYAYEFRPPIHMTPTHLFHPGDEVWVKDWKGETLQPKWKGPYVVILTSPSAVKVAEIKPWLHWTRIKKAAPSWHAIPDPKDPLKLKITRNFGCSNQKEGGGK